MQTVESNFKKDNKMLSLESAILEKTSLTRLEPAAAVASVYVSIDNDAEVKVEATYASGEFILQRELVKHFPDDEFPTSLDIAYTRSGNYVGTLETLHGLLDRGITEQLQPLTEDRGICSIGFNPEEQKWYGWSHRAIFGFTIGSGTNRGDCSYVPVDKEDLLNSIKSFWDHGIPRKGGGSNTHMTFTSSIENVRFDVEHEGVLGMFYDNISTCSDPSGPALSSRGNFEPYPVPWGRGEWKATTLDEAKEMAIAFSRGVS